jgi:sugar lactone lactonase YvrE
MIRPVLVSATAALVVVTAGLAGVVSGSAASGAQAPITVSEGLLGPETVLHDTQTDVYLVSNVNGDPSGKDDNGFISRVSPDGKVLELKWIDGAAADVTLHAPKGMAFRREYLLVADIDAVRVFDRKTGKQAGNWPVNGATFLNDIAVSADNVVYVTDTAISFAGGSAKPQGTAAVYRFEGDQKQPTMLSKGEALRGPNGIAATPEGPVFVTFLGNHLLRLKAKADAPETVATLPAGGLDGLARLSDGSFVVSSWEAQGVFQVTAGGQARQIVRNVSSPAGIEVDEKRRRVLVPQLMENRLVIGPLE